MGANGNVLKTGMKTFFIFMDVVSEMWYNFLCYVYWPEHSVPIFKTILCYGR